MPKGVLMKLIGVPVCRIHESRCAVPAVYVNQFGPRLGPWGGSAPKGYNADVVGGVNKHRGFVFVLKHGRAVYPPKP